MYKLKFVLPILLIPFQLFAADPPKKLQTKFVEKAPKIDGVLDDNAWKNTDKATDFVMFRPGTGTPEPENQKTVVRVVYNNEALYVGAYLYDDDPASIPMQFKTRDNFGQTDFFGVMLNPDNDHVNDTQFYVQSTGNQADAKVSSSGGEDFSWSAVWESAVSLNDDGWVVEMKIPYSALRFSNKGTQVWGLNFHRHIRSTREQYSWNFIDKTKGRIMEYAGELVGIENIDPPVRLSFYPYAQGSYSHSEGEGDFKGSAGMDLKYGISESFTLDATLIPDFGQTAFDDIVLNLGPFEQRYKEKRAFFTEGTELFEKGNLFYSRRVGSTPIAYDDVEESMSENDMLIENPEKTRLLNAVKLSGRTKGGLGIGVFNALTNTTRATIRNKEDGSERKIVTDPFTNYNVLVLDQQFNKNSSVSLINTNVLRQGHFYDANVTSGLLDLRIKDNKYALLSDLSLSNKFYSDYTDSGFKGNWEVKKVSGAHRYGLEVSLSDTLYDKNDLGFSTQNNYVNYQTFYHYQIFEPKGNFNRLGLYTWAYLNYLFKPYTYTDNGVGASFWATTKSEFSFGGNINLHFGYEYDYYEPRVAGRFYKKNQAQFLNLWMSSDYRKKFAIDVILTGGFQPKAEGRLIGFEIEPRYRFTDRFQLIYSLDLEKLYNYKSYVDNDENNIIFGNRDRMTITNSLLGTYNFSTKSALSLSFRHYWSPVTYDDQFYNLQDDGTLLEIEHSKNYNDNFNSWNLDLSYSWEFAPGSQLVALYRNTISNSNNQSDLSFFKNIDQLFEEPISHQFSLKFIYYIDYNKVRTWL